MQTVHLWPTFSKVVPRTSPEACAGSLAAAGYPHHHRHRTVTVVILNRRVGEWECQIVDLISGSR